MARKVKAAPAVDANKVVDKRKAPAKGKAAPAVDLVKAAAEKLKADMLPLENAVHGKAPAKGKAAAPSALEQVPAQWNAAEREVIAAAQDGNAAFAREVAALKAAAQDGKACKTYSTIYKAAVVAHELGYAAGDAGVVAALALLISNAKRTDAEQRAVALAANRLSRRLKAAGLESATPRRKRTGAGGKTDGKTVGKTDGKTDGNTPAPKTDNTPVVMSPRAVRAPIIANEVEWAAHLHDLAAYMRTARSKNAKSATARVRKVIDAFLKAEAALAKVIAPAAE